jgi:hypothetical protein
MSQTTGWVPDPYGVHEFRFFSADGKPTLLVMDGGKRSYDRPPTTEPPPAPEPSPISEPPPAPEPSPRSECEPPPVGGTRPGLDSPRTVADADQAAVRMTMPPSDVKTDHSADPPSTTARGQARVAVPPVTHYADDRSTRGVVDRSPEPLSRPLKIGYGVVFGVLAVSVLGFAYVHLHHPGTSPSRSAQRATTTSSVIRTTTTVALPTALKPGAEAAATALISSWATQNRSAALTVATQAAVTTLFAVPYANGLAEDRGCSTSFTPIVCTFGPPGGASPNDPIYQVLVSQAPGGWYVSSVKLENAGSGNTSTSS